MWNNAFQESFSQNQYQTAHILYELVYLIISTGLSHWLRATYGRTGLSVNIAMGIRASVIYVPCSWKFVKPILMSAIILRLLVFQMPC